MKHVTLKFLFAASILSISFNAQAKVACLAFADTHSNIPARISSDLSIVTREFGESLANVRQQLAIRNFHPDVPASAYRPLQLSPNRETVLLQAPLNGEMLTIAYDLKRGVVWSHHGNGASIRFLNNSVIAVDVNLPDAKHKWIDDFVTGEQQDLTPRPSTLTKLAKGLWWVVEVIDESL